MTGAELKRRVAADRRLITGWLRRSLRADGETPGRLGRAMRYAVLGPGKRIRSILALEAFRAAGGREESRVEPFCCGIEMIHSFSLVHDDLPSMDDDDYRRGRPSAHRRFGEALAILAADALLARAFELFATGPAPAGRRLEAAALLARAVGPRGMAGGQVLDIEAGPRTGRRALTRIRKMKTADFLAAAMAAGAVVGGAPPAARARLQAAGLLLGDLFQVTDDLLDAAGHDAADKATVVRNGGAGAARRQADRLAARAEERLRSLGRRYQVLAAFPGMVLERSA